MPDSERRESPYKLYLNASWMTRGSFDWVSVTRPNCAAVTVVFGFGH